MYIDYPEEQKSLRRELREYFAELITPEIKEATRNLPTIPGEIPDLVEIPAGCAFAERCPDVFAPCRERRPAAGDPGRCLQPSLPILRCL